MIIYPFNFGRIYLFEFVFCIRIYWHVFSLHSNQERLNNLKDSLNSQGIIDKNYKGILSSYLAGLYRENLKKYRRLKSTAIKYKVSLAINASQNY